MAGLLRAEFEKAVSDGNYGTERCRLAIEIPLEDTEEWSESAAATLLSRLRLLVHDELRASPSSRVRAGVEYTEPPPVLNLGREAGAKPDSEDLPF